jgi:hypothetical protein
MGYLTVHAEPWGALLVDGRPFANQTPVYRAPIAAGHHRVAVVNPETHRHSPEQTINVEAGSTRVVGFEW